MPTPPHRWLFSYTSSPHQVMYSLFITQLPMTEWIYILAFYMSSTLLMFGLWKWKQESAARAKPLSSDITVLFKPSCACRWVTVKHHTFTAPWRAYSEGPTNECTQQSLDWTWRQLGRTNIAPWSTSTVFLSSKFFCIYPKSITFL